ncbi:MAG: RNA polymerase sigma-70 factor [Gelidibacter sp.]
MNPKAPNNDIVHFQNFKTGNEAAFNYFFQKHHNALVGFCINFLYDKDKSSSIAQEAFISLWQNKEKVETINGVKAFLYTSAKSKCLNILRHEKIVLKHKNSTIQEKERLLNIEVLKAFEFDSLTFKELQETIDKAIEELPDKTKEVFIKSRFENKKNKEIAMEMEFSVKSVEAHMTKALKILKTKLSHMHFLLLFV